MKNFEARNGRFETSSVVKNQRVKQREQRTLGDCWQWKANGQFSKGDNQKKIGPDGQGDAAPKTCGGGLARVPNLRVCKHL